MPGLTALVIVPRFNTGSTYHYDRNLSDTNYAYYLPSGLAYIIASLKAAGFAVDVLNPNHSDDTTRNAVREMFFERDYRVVFTGGVSLNYPVIKDIVTYVREISSAKVVVGGGIITAQPDVVFDLIRPDIAVIGEGEQTCVEICEAIRDGTPIRNVKGILFRNVHGLGEYTATRDTYVDIDTLPFPDYDSMGFARYLDNQSCSFVYDHFDHPRPYPILASRSCPFNCTFCFHTTGKKYRQRSIDNVMSEVRHAIEKYHVNMFFFYDELFTHSEARAIEFCQRFKEVRENAGYEITFTVELRVDGITESLLDALKGAGCTEICLGLESYNQSVLDSMKKRISPEQIKTALEMITRTGIAPVGNFIFGDPEQTLDTAKDTIDFFRNRQDILHGVRVAFIIPFQGSEIYRRMRDDGRIPSDETFISDRAVSGYDFHEPVNMTRLSDDDFNNLKDTVFTAHYTSGTYAVPDSVAGRTVVLTCPVCGRQNTYSNIDPPSYISLTNIGCRHCNARFEMVSATYLYLIKPLIERFGFMRLYNLRKVVIG
jgi:radical SAM superfamily enzyme YgiQ (UPF0313 family)